jgi:tetratricopeptide (TPR) repeat protein
MSRPARNWLVLGGLVLAAAPVALLTGLTFVGVVAGLYGLLLIGIGVQLRGRGVAVPSLMRALRLVQLRDFREADKALDALSSTSPGPSVRRVSLNLRALVAMRRGEIEAALSHLDAALAVPQRFDVLLEGATGKSTAKGMRAFLRAAQGQAPAARSDLEAVRADPRATLPALAYATLAEAVLLERSGDFAALRALLDREGGFLIEASEPRERALVRAYQRMVQVRAPRGVYRVGAPREEQAADGGEPALTDWIARIAPGAAPFVRPSPARRTAPCTSDDPSDVAVVPAQPSLRRTRNVILAVALVVAILAGASGGARGLLALEARTGRGFVDDVVMQGMTVFGIGFLFLLVLVVFRLGVTRDSSRRLDVATRLLARGDLEGGVAAANIVRRRKRLPLTAARAEAILADACGRRGDYAGALAACDRGLSLVAAPRMKAFAADFHLPVLLGERALALAALDRGDEALAVLASIDRGWTFLPTARLSVELVRLARLGQLEDAARLVDDNPPDVGLSRPVELLADVVRAAVAKEAVGAAEIARLEGELRSWPQGKAWLEAVAPLALAAFERSQALGPSEKDAEREQAAEAEAEAGVAVARVIP